MIDSIINCDNPKEADAIVVSVGYDRTASHGKGAINGASAIIKGLKEDVEFLDRYSKTEPGYSFNIHNHDLGNLNALLPEEMVARVKDAFLKLYVPSRFQMLLGGEHSVSIGALQAIAERHNPKDITILQIDAHPDLRDDDSNSNPDQSRPTKFAHACVMRRAHELGFKIVQVGIRSYSMDEYLYLQKHRDIKTFEWGLGKTPSVSKIIKSIKTDKVYLDIDVDGFDPAHMPATGTPVQGGLEWYYGLDLIRKTIEKKDVIAADILEVSPRPNDVLTEYGAAQLCYNIISQRLLK